MLQELLIKAEELGFYVEVGSISGNRFITISQGVDYYNFLALFDDKTFIFEREHFTNKAEKSVKTIYGMALAHGYKNRIYNLDKYVYYNTNKGYYKERD